MSHTLYSRIVVPCLCVSMLTVLGGCFYPGMYGRPYGPGIYAPPRAINPGPGYLHIPESGSEYVPGSDYNGDPPDDFEKSGDDQYYGADDEDVPYPSDTNTFEQDDSDIPWQSSLDDGTQNAFAARPVSQNSTALPLEYGFDTANYRWLRGLLRQDRETGGWLVIYSQAAADEFRGRLPLRVNTESLGTLRDGSPVDVRGALRRTQDGQTYYDVELIRHMTTRIAL